MRGLSTREAYRYVHTMCILRINQCAPITYTIILCNTYTYTIETLFIVAVRLNIDIIITIKILLMYTVRCVRNRQVVRGHMSPFVSAQASRRFSVRNASRYVSV